MKWAFLFPLFLYSAPIGNPATPALLEEGFFISDQAWSCPEAAYAGDFLFEKRFQSARSGYSEIQMKGVSQIGEIAWCIRERFLVQLELGSGDFQWRWRQSGSALSGRAQDGLIWSGSGKLLILEAKDTSVAVDGHAGGWDWMDGPATIDGVPQMNTTQTTLRYWQVGVGLTQKISLFVPYVGVAVNQTRFKVQHLFTGSASFQSWYTVGPFLGCSLTNGSRFFINLEWRGWFEDGLSLAGQVRF